MKHVLVTGGTGFIGSKLLSSDKFKFRHVVRGTTKKQFDDIFLVNEISSKTNWSDAFFGIDAVIHLAGIAHDLNFQEEEFFEVNKHGTLHLANEAANAGVKRFVYISTIGVNGEATFGEPFSEKDLPKPYNYYSKSKHEAEIGLIEIAKKTGLEVVIIRPPLVYGKGARGNFNSLVNIVKKVRLLPFGLINNKRSFISVSNLVSFILVCLEHEKAIGEVFIISDGDPISTRVFTSLIGKGVNKKTLQLPIPRWFLQVTFGFLGQQYRLQKVIGDLEVDSSKAKRLLSWTPLEDVVQAMKHID
ncbi:NAD-dependent epimerase/dehydratase family protein [uncultured Shewanella sp.]|uniref:NAD-dependent epimerase/dehydratase family protein n=1 Tax=uncultured Shewanella sp. TaxID=173975 RepID=UPI002616DC37|nr:NAD-dependent epimerase/dehydratase family protein [uncultured Shewanella sp.]